MYQSHDPGPSISFTGPLVFEHYPCGECKLLFIILHKKSESWCGYNLMLWFPLHQAKLFQRWIRGQEMWLLILLRGTMKMLIEQLPLLARHSTMDLGQRWQPMYFHPYICCWTTYRFYDLWFHVHSTKSFFCLLLVQTCRKGKRYCYVLLIWLKSTLMRLLHLRHGILGSHTNKLLKLKFQLLFVYFDTMLVCWFEKH